MGIWGALILFLIIVVFWEFIKKIFSKILDGLTEKIFLFFKCNKSFYKKKSGELLLKLDKLIEEDSELREKRLPKINLRKTPIAENVSDWNIIRIDSEMDKKRIEESVIMQVPKSCKFELERNLLKPKYKQGLFYAMSKRLAEETGNNNLLSVIDDKIMEDGVDREFLVMEEILKSDTKRRSMIEEARRKWIYLGGSISVTAKKEFCKFLDKLKNGRVGVMTIFGKPPALLLKNVQMLLKNYDIVCLYARRKKHVKVLGELKKLIKKNIGIKIEEDDKYEWEDSDRKVSYMARTLRLIRK